MLQVKHLGELVDLYEAVAVLVEALNQLLEFVSRVEAMHFRQDNHELVNRYRSTVVHVIFSMKIEREKTHTHKASTC